MENHNIHSLIDRYLKGTASASEHQLLENWLDELALGANTDPIDIDVKRKLAKKKLMVQIKVKKAKTFPYLKVAAAMLPLVLMAALFWSYYSSIVKEITVSTSYGEFQELWLPDSTKVLLKPSSTLTYPASFDSERKVHLMGSAFFEVRRDTLKQFMVSSENLMVQVLGTSFEVVSYENMPEQRITVASGRVSVSHNGGSEAVLNLSDQLVINKATGFSKRDKVDFYTQLNNQRMIFQEASLEEMVTLLSTYYQIQIHFPTETNIALSANLDAKLDVKDILEVLNVLLENYTLSIHQTGEHSYEIQ